MLILFFVVGVFFCFVFTRLFNRDVCSVLQSFWGISPNQILFIIKCNTHGDSHFGQGCENFFFGLCILSNSGLCYIFFELTRVNVCVKLTLYSRKRSLLVLASSAVTKVRISTAVFSSFVLFVCFLLDISSLLICHQGNISSTRCIYQIIWYKNKQTN